jgi:hypothetical protein
MAEPDQPKKETVRIELPRPPVTPPAAPPAPSVSPRQTVRIQLPVRETGNALVPSSPPSATRPLSAPVRPPSIPPSTEPKKETARIPLMSEPLRSGQKKTQPLMAMPDVIPQNPAIAVAPVEKSSMLMYWMLLGMSALILVIEIWTYFS